MFNWIFGTDRILGAIENLMGAVADLKNEVVALRASIDAAIAKLSQDNPDVVQAVVDLKAMQAALDAVTGHQV